MYVHSCCNARQQQQQQKVIPTQSDVTNIITENSVAAHIIIAQKEYMYDVETTLDAAPFGQKQRRKDVGPVSGVCWGDQLWL